MLLVTAEAVVRSQAVPEFFLRKHMQLRNSVRTSSLSTRTCRRAHCYASTLLFVTACRAGIRASFGQLTGLSSSLHYATADRSHSWREHSMPAHLDALVRLPPGGSPAEAAILHRAGRDLEPNT